MSLRNALIAVALVGAVAAAIGIPVRATYGAHVSVDEPQYLLSAISIAEDRSLDISDELEERRYVPFHAVPVDRQTEPLEGGREVSPHDPLLPALLALPMWIGGWVGAKLFLCLLNAALAALVAWIAHRRFEVPLRTASWTAGIFAASAPFAVYGQQVYPELPAAVAVAVGIACLTGLLRRGGLIGSALAVIALPWLSIKYAPVAAALALLVVVRCLREGRKRESAALVGGLALAGALFIVLHLAWYGGVTPYATGDHFASTGELSVVGTDVDILGRARRLIGLMVDDRFGLAAWQPAFLLAFAAAGALLRARPRGWTALAVPVAAGWLNATFVALTMQGWWWPGRQVVVVLPAIVVAIAWWVGRSSARLRSLRVLGAAGLFLYLWLVVEGWFREVTWVVDFFETSNPLYRGWSAVLPDYLDVTPLTWVLQTVWLGVAAVLFWLGWRGTGTGDVTRSPREEAAAPISV